MVSLGKIVEMGKDKVMAVSDNPKLWLIVKRALRRAIKHHGPITETLISSTVRRVVDEISSSGEKWSELVAGSTKILNETKLGAIRVSRQRVADKAKEQKKTHQDKVKHLEEEHKKQIDLKKDEIKKLKNQYLDFIGKLQTRITELEGEKANPVSKKNLHNSAITGQSKVVVTKQAQPKTSKATFRQITTKIAETLYAYAGFNDAEKDWLLAEKIGISLLNWKPDGKRYFAEIC